VLVDGRAMYSCLLLAIDCVDREIITIEGLADGDALDPVQQAFIEHDAFQCGFCTPGQIMSLRGLLNDQPNPSTDEIRRAVTGNLCRCGAYLNIVKAGERAVELQREAATR
jgi:xanthine dehydrogenase YagT iron-sulfur-binding subunit